MNKKVIVTGASGQDGSFMSEYLLKNTDYDVIGTVRRTSQPILNNLINCIENKRFSIMPMDLTDSSSIINLIKREKPDYFINFGAQTFVADSWNSPINHFETNTISLINILESIRNFSPDCRFYSAGSSEQFGDVKYSPQDENHPFSPRSPYGASKCAANHLIKVYRESYGIYATQGIIFNHEGTRRQEYFITRKITKGVAKIFDEIVNNRQITPLELGNVNSERDWSDAEDIVDAVWRMLNQEKYNHSVFDEKFNKTTKNYSKLIKDYVVGNGEKHSIREFVEKSFEVVGIKGKWFNSGLNECFMFQSGPRESELVLTKLVVINPKFYRPAEVDTLLSDSTKIREELGWNPKTTFNELIDKMVSNDLTLIQSVV
jgi:GDPmannose 4,6-dehydratase